MSLPKTSTIEATTGNEAAGYWLAQTRAVLETDELVPWAREELANQLYEEHARGGSHDLGTALLPWVDWRLLADDFIRQIAQEPAEDPL